MDATRKQQLEALCNRLRMDVISLLHSIQTGHPGGSLSVCEILAALYFEKARLNPADPCDEHRDRIILSKGHAAPMLYAVLAELGYFPREELAGLRRQGSRLQGHPCAAHTPGVELPSGPLGLGLSAGLGKALALRLEQNPARVYVVLGDGELNEGAVWEAAMAAAKFKADSLTAIVDCNGVQLDGACEDIMPMESLADKWRAFGWHVFCCDGHDIGALCAALDGAGETKGRPSVILAKTVKGRGVSFMEGRHTWHGSPIGNEHYAKAMAELGGRANG